VFDASSVGVGQASPAANGVGDDVTASARGIHSAGGPRLLVGFHASLKHPPATRGRSVRAERRGGGLLGRTSFLRTHTRPTVAREPSPEVYRAVREARKSLPPSMGGRTGKGLNNASGSTPRAPLQWSARACSPQPSPEGTDGSHRAHTHPGPSHMGNPQVRWVTRALQRLPSSFEPPAAA